MAVDSRQAHMARHQFLHAALDELVADFLSHTPGGIESSLSELMVWSSKQMTDPDERPLTFGERHRDGLEAMGEQTYRLCIEASRDEEV